MPKAKKLGPYGDNPPVVAFWCPGCLHHHVVPYSTSNPPPTTPCLWYFNEDFEHPTISPSLRVFQMNGTDTACHTIVTNGIINYCADSAHALAGQSIPMIECKMSDEGTYDVSDYAEG